MIRLREDCRMGVELLSGATEDLDAVRADSGERFQKRGVGTNNLLHALMEVGE
jgi:hypothetical protein